MDLVAESIDFPGLGNRYQVDYGDPVKFDIEFKDLDKVIFSQSHNPVTSESLAVNIYPLKPNTYLVCWQSKEKNTVIHVLDFDQELIHTHVTNLRGDLSFKSGSIVRKLES